MKIVSNIFYAIFIILLLGVAGLFLVPLLPIDNSIQMKIVESGSMEPAILTGSLVVIAPASDYVINDIITFESISSNVPTTHRIVDVYEENGTKWFVTKGDANEESDNNAVPASSIIGKIMVVVPYAGFILDFARQPMGFMLLIMLPALMVILSEIEKIWREYHTIRKQRTSKQIKESDDSDRSVADTKTIRMMDIAVPVRYSVYEIPVKMITVKNSTHYGSVRRQWATPAAIILASVLFASLSFTGSTVSYFNDTESSLLNSLRTRLLDFTVSPETMNHYFIDNEDGVLVAVVTPESGSTDVLYDVSTSYTGGVLSFCDAIIVDAGLPLSFTGPLNTLSGQGVSFDDAWNLVLILEDGSGPFAESDWCEIDIVYTARAVEAESGEGYSDEERVSLVLYAPQLMDNFTAEAPQLLLSVPSDLTSDTIIGESTLELETLVEDLDSDEETTNPVIPEEEEGIPVLLKNEIDPIDPEPLEEESENTEIIETEGEVQEL